MPWYPFMRIDVIDALEALGNRDAQRRNWFDCKAGDPPASPPYEILPNLDTCIHILYDDTEAASHPEEWVGRVLWDSEEVLALQKLGEAIDCVLDTYDDNRKDSFYIETPEWDDVVVRAQSAYGLLTHNDRTGVTPQKMELKKESE